MAGPEHQEDVKEHDDDDDDDDDDGEVEIVVGVLIVDCCSSHCLRRRFCTFDNYVIKLKTGEKKLLFLNVFSLQSLRFRFP